MKTEQCNAGDQCGNGKVGGCKEKPGKSRDHVGGLERGLTKESLERLKANGVSQINFFIDGEGNIGPVFIDSQGHLMPEIRATIEGQVPLESQIYAMQEIIKEVNVYLETGEPPVKI